ncbi:helicase IV [Pseudomonas syringae pv. rhaphiolepidis]|nr:helicase IV [Pseudomonas syringae pv. rhaphiolepidis]
MLEEARSLVEAPDARLEQVRDQYVDTTLTQYHDLFETIETKPLTLNQRRACVIDEDNNLIMAGAGTGKTSTVIGRVAFLIESRQANPEDILLLAYGKEAAKEMRERLETKLGVKGITAATFHALGRCIVEKVEQNPLELAAMAKDDKLKAHFVNNVFEAQQHDAAYRQLLLAYFEQWLHPAPNPFDFKSLGEYYRFLEDNHIRTLKGEHVKGFGECDIANFLFKNGIEYQYEPRYDTPLQSSDRGAYHPDFYLPKLGIYIEHFGIDRKGDTAPYIDRAKYHADMQWKRQVHDQAGTRLIETYHYEKQEGVLLAALKERLTDAGATYKPLPPEAVLETLREFGAIKKFSIILRDMLGLIRSANLSIEDQIDLANRAANPEQVQAALILLAPIMTAYEQELRGKQQVDYDDMINKAWSYVDNGQFESPWKFIVVDEFQDIAKSRADLVLALKKNKDDASLFCVGDDWQSIYRFTGSDITFTSQFQMRFGATKTSDLDKTFRFNSQIGEVASRFVMQNGQQLVKTIKSHTVVDSPMVSLVRVSLKSKAERQEAILSVASRVAQIAAPGSSVYFLARFKTELPDPQSLARQFPHLTFKADSIHTSKGKEADYVVVLGVVKGEYGLPSEKAAHPLVEALLPKAELYPHAEERRLFYVALTRAKHRVYLVTDMVKCSPFIQELVKGRYPIDLEEFTTTSEQNQSALANCPVCQEGTLMTRVNGTTKESFSGCSNWPLCRHTERSCPKCDGPLDVHGRFKVCTKADCSGWLAICPASGGYMAYRPTARKWGCSHYRKGNPQSCGHMEQYIAAPTKRSS